MGSGPKVRTQRIPRVGETRIHGEKDNVPRSNGSTQAHSKSPSTSPLPTFFFPSFISMICLEVVARRRNCPLRSVFWVEVLSSAIGEYAPAYEYHSPEFAGAGRRARLCARRAPIELVQQLGRCLVPSHLLARHRSGKKEKEIQSLFALRKIKPQKFPFPLKRTRAKLTLTTHHTQASTRQLDNVTRTTLGTSMDPPPAERPSQRLA